MTADRSITLIIHAYKGGSMIGTVYVNNLNNSSVTVPACSYIDVYSQSGQVNAYSYQQINMTYLVHAGTLYKNGSAMPLIGGSSSTSYQSYWYLNTAGTQVVCSSYNRALGKTILVCYK